ncbi:MAG: S41 family peptidase [Cyclobacteriaceae bacterium]|nr:S41 family peptidase [Cyclobacteriaceae bacterium]
MAKDYKKSLIYLFVFVLLGSVAFVVPTDRYFEISKAMELYSEVYKEINTSYVDEVNPNLLMQTGIEGMLSSLDPYTNYIPEDRIEEFRTQNTGQYGGIGALSNIIDGKKIIMMIMENSPSMKSGLKIGDEIIEINGINIRGLSREETGKLTRGQANTPVTLTVLRYGIENPIKIEIIREQIQIPAVSYQGMIDEHIGLIRLTEFTQHAGKDVRDAVEELKKKGAKKLILDLRDNPGGLLVEARNICNIFLPKNMEVVTTRGKLPENNVTYKTLNKPLDTEIPLVVLINDGSASASEIVAGTLQDYDRAVIIGEKSFGKGLVQVNRHLSYHSQLKVTIAKYYTPSGRCIQALDYSHRLEDGEVLKIPDSLKNSFLTSNKRIVYDGAGIDPDVKAGKNQLSQVTERLIQNGHLFHFATEYYYNHETIESPSAFEISSQTYNDFISWMKKKSFTYYNEVEKNIEQLEAIAHSENLSSAVKNSIEQLKSKMESEKKDDFTRFSDEIKRVLEMEIVGRYYFEKGTIESSFKDDPYIKTAEDHLNNPDSYKSILKIDTL